MVCSLLNWQTNKTPGLWHLEDVNGPERNKSGPNIESLSLTWCIEQVQPSVIDYFTQSKRFPLSILFATKERALSIYIVFLCVYPLSSSYFPKALQHWLFLCDPEEETRDLGCGPVAFIFAETTGNVKRDANKMRAGHHLRQQRLLIIININNTYRKSLKIQSSFTNTDWPCTASIFKQLKWYVSYRRDY